MRSTFTASVTFTEFRSELEKEVSYLNDGATSYRQKTAELSLRVAELVKDVKPFFSLDTALQTVKNFFPKEDVFRLQDVAKMLSVVLNDLLSKATLPDELKQKLNQRRQNRSFKLVLA
jgi:hypothetical protein